MLLVLHLKASTSTRSDGRLFDLARLNAKTKVREATTRDILFADDAAVTSYTEQELQRLMHRFSQTFKYFGLTISLKKDEPAEPGCGHFTYHYHR